VPRLDNDAVPTDLVLIEDIVEDITKYVHPHQKYRAAAQNHFLSMIAMARTIESFVN